MKKKKCNELRADMNFNRLIVVPWTEVLYCPSFTYASNSQRLEELKTPPLILEFLFYQWSHDYQYFPDKIQSKALLNRLQFALKD